MMRSSSSKVLAEAHFCESEQIVAFSAKPGGERLQIDYKFFALRQRNLWALSQSFRVGVLLRTFLIWYQDGKIDNSPRR